jgi:hypothetical protein
MNEDDINQLQESVRRHLRNREQKRKERRRYALLGAAATVYGSAGVYRDSQHGYIRVCTVESAVGEAEALLQEIERREMQEACS